MQIFNFNQRSQEWLAARKGKVTGSRLGDLMVYRGTKRKLGFYEILAERLGIVDEDPFLEEIGPMERGKVLEQEGLDLWAEKNGLELTQAGLCVSDENPSIAFSPDSLIADKDGVFVAAVEEKCLKPSKHLQAYFEQKMPDEYFEQTIQPFIVSDEIQTVYCVFYNPRVLDLPIFHVTINRADVLNEIQNLKAYQVEALIEMDNLIKTLK